MSDTHAQAVTPLSLSCLMNPRHLKSKVHQKTFMWGNLDGQRVHGASQNKQTKKKKKTKNVGSILIARKQSQQSLLNIPKNFSENAVLPIPSRSHKKLQSIHKMQAEIIPWPDILLLTFSIPLIPLNYADCI